MNLDKRISEDSFFTPRDLVKIWGTIFVMLAVLASCGRSLDRDDNRMQESFIQECEAKNKPDQPRTNVDCNAAFRKAYRETFGR